MDATGGAAIAGALRLGLPVNIRNVSNVGRMTQILNMQYKLVKTAKLGKASQIWLEGCDAIMWRFFSPIYGYKICKVSCQWT